jgi:ABC-type transport system involved in multi-copper enzyme maturation permease subunit
MKAQGSGILGGFWNKIREENGRWWETRKWLVQCGIWLILINGITSIFILESRQAATALSVQEILTVFTGVMGWMAAFGVIILTQSDIVEEKLSGTAEWVLSSPLSRGAFILSKLVVNSLWLLGIIVVLQGVIFDLLLGFFGFETITIGYLVQGLALQGLHLFFWLSLIILLGTFFGSRNPVIGIPLIFLFVQRLIPEVLGAYVGWIQLVMPERLTDYSYILFTGGQLPSWVPVVVMALASLIFVVLSVLRFRREEF